MQIAQIAESIAEFGFTNPILVDSKTGIIAGHGRLLAGRRLGLTEVAVIVLDHLTETQKRAYIIADNRLALNAGWDDELLALELQDLKDADCDLDLTGFDVAEIDRMLAARDDDKANEAPPLPNNPVSPLGDLLLSGDSRIQHRVLRGDATRTDAVARLLGERKPFLMVNRSSLRDRVGTAELTEFAKELLVRCCTARGFGR